jgi:hypothetical protein
MVVSLIRMGISCPSTIPAPGARKSAAGELREIAQHALRVGAKDVQAVAMHEHAGRIMAIVGIAADVTARSTISTRLSRWADEPFGQHAAGESAGHD